MKIIHYHYHFYNTNSKEIKKLKKKLKKERAQAAQAEQEKINKIKSVTEAQFNEARDEILKTISLHDKLEDLESTGKGIGSPTVPESIISDVNNVKEVPDVIFYNSVKPIHDTSKNIDRSIYARAGEKIKRHSIPHVDDSLSTDSKRYKASPEYQKNHNDKNVPNLQAENLNAAFALNRELNEMYPHKLTMYEVSMFLNKKKDCLRYFRHPAHYANYQNIFSFLYNTGRMRKVSNNRNTRHWYQAIK